MGEGADVSRESIDATCTRDPAPQVRVWRDRARDCPIDWHRARSTVALTVERAAAAAAKLSWPLPATLTDRVLEAMLYASAGALHGLRRKAEPDWTHVHRELRRPGVTLMLLWEEYRASEPDGYSYSWCELYRAGDDIAIFE
jgi:hypothetical protein